MKTLMLSMLMLCISISPELGAASAETDPEAILLAGCPKAAIDCPAPKSKKKSSGSKKKNKGKSKKS